MVTILSDVDETREVPQRRAAAATSGVEVDCPPVLEEHLS
jgi:hypothetical protein